MRADLEKLISLHEIDQKLVESRSKIEAFQKEAELVETEYQKFAAAFNDTTEALAAARQRSRDLETELADTQARHDKYKADLMKVRNQKEYETALREIDSAKKISSQLETQILEALEEVKRLEEEAGKFSPDIENKRTEADAALAEITSRRSAYESGIAEIQAQRAQIEAAVAKSWLDRYNRVVKMRAGQGLAEVVNGACSACRMKLRPQVFSEIRRGDTIYTCDHCSRILYYKAEAKVEVFEA